MENSFPKFVVVDDANYRLSDPCDTEGEARAQAEFNSECAPVQHVCRVCPECGEHEVIRQDTWAYGLQVSWHECNECGWYGEPE